MYGLPLDHLQKLVVVLHCYVSVINVCMKFFKAKTERCSPY